MSERVWLIEVFRLHYQERLSQNRIAKRLGLPRTTVNSCFLRAARVGVHWPINELTLERTLYPGKKRYQHPAPPPAQSLALPLPATTAPPEQGTQAELPAVV